MESKEVIKSISKVLSNMDVYNTTTEHEYYVIQSGDGTYLSDVWEDQNTEDEGGNYEFTPTLAKALKIRMFEGKIELPKYLFYHTDGTHIDDMGHYLQLIGGRILEVHSCELKAVGFSLKEVKWEK